MTSMHQPNDMHLTDAQFSDLLAGDSAPEAAMQHLEHCGGCRAELADIQSSMHSFNAISLAWAELEAPRRIHPPSRWALNRRAIPAWGLACATALAIAAIGVRHENTLRQADQSVVATATVSAEPSSSNLADDNRLMMSIDQELNYQVQSPVPASELRAGAFNRYSTSQVAN